MAQPGNRTVPTAVEPAAFLAAVEPERRRAEAQALDAVFRKVTGWTPAMWGPSLVGYGRYDYRYDSGREGSFLATGFAPGKARLSIHILPGYRDHGAILGRLGPHTLGRACVYITRLDRVDRDVLAELIRAGLDDLAQHWPVYPA